MVAQVRTAADLLTDPWISRWATDGYASKGKPFYRFSQAMDTPSRPSLMAEYDDGKVWWVVGFMDAPMDDLPHWDPKR